MKLMRFWFVDVLFISFQLAVWNCLVLCVQTESGPQEALELWRLSESRNTPGVPAISCCEIDEIWLGWWNHSYYITSGPMSIYLWSTGGAGDCAVMEMMRFMVAWPSFELWQVNKLIDFRGPTETGAATFPTFLFAEQTKLSSAAARTRQTRSR